MRRLLPAFLLLLPLLANGQVVVTPSGWATSAGPAVPVAPMSPPQVMAGTVALPGSGTPAGMPPDLNVNNAATGGYVTVYRPGVVVYGSPANPVTPLSNLPASTQNAANAAAAKQAGGFAMGIGNFVGSARNPAAATKPASLAEIASGMGTKPLIKDSKITNEDIAALANQNQSGRHVITNADLQSMNLTGAPANNDPGTQQNASAEKPLDRSDLNQVQSALANGQAGANATGTEVAQATPQNPEEYQRVVQEAEAGGQHVNANNAQAAPTEPITPSNNAEQGNRPAKGQELPASGSPLPILALVGLIAIGTGMVYRWTTP